MKKMITRPLSRGARQVPWNASSQVAVDQVFWGLRRSTEDSSC